MGKNISIAVQEEFTRESLEKTIQVLENKPIIKIFEEVINLDEEESQIEDRIRESDKLLETRIKVYSFIDKKLRRKFYSERTIDELQAILFKKRQELLGLKESIDSVELGSLITKRRYKKLSKKLFSETINPFFSELVGREISENNLPKVKIENSMTYHVKKTFTRFDLQAKCREVFNKPIKGRKTNKNQTEFKKEVFLEIPPNNPSVAFVHTLVHEEAHRYQKPNELLSGWVPILNEGHAMGVTSYFADKIEDKDQIYFTKLVDYISLVYTYNTLCSLKGHKRERLEYEEFLDEKLKKVPMVEMIISQTSEVDNMPYKMSRLNQKGLLEINQKGRDLPEHWIGQTVIEILKHKNGDRVLSQMFKRDYSALIDYLFE